MRESEIYSLSCSAIGDPSCSDSSNCYHSLSNTPVVAATFGSVSWAMTKCLMNLFALDIANDEHTLKSIDRSFGECALARRFA